MFIRCLLTSIKKIIIKNTVTNNYVVIFGTQELTS
ncbi:hypothetical protein CoNPh10_CDS0151 [Staphylococcus phage S-CoN_Ph10]|nr:hypothetical protein CoNPh10_CDS0151 [Staphylococcus phage S-CoN_Ph10]